ncbi:MAG: DUF4290 domain-containing protein [Salinivirgaceae bacterium]|nr:DUF4290 domain-containing protein [Salinivirgaceae bacterium]MBR5957492.1 DUF4290 domain-containing protein [Salinivirgaceae bacterium]
MDYNTNRDKLLLPEYGRNVQKMVQIIKKTDDRESRNNLAKATMQLMENMNPSMREMSDYKQKLWDHLAVISDYDLDVDSPYPMPQPAEKIAARKKPLYSNPDEIRFKHYGKVLENMVRRATQYPEGEERDALVEILGNQMKKSFLTWNRETVSDDLIFSDMLAIACNKLTIPEGLKLKDTKDLIKEQTQQMANSGNAKKKKNNNKKQAKKKPMPKKK